MPKTTKKSFQGLGVVIIILLALNLVFNAVDFFDKGADTGSALAVEQLKAGGTENFEIMKQIFESSTYQAQQKMNLLQTLESFGGEAEAQGDAPVAVEEETEEEEEVTIEDVSNDEDMIKAFKDITDEAHIVGDKDARFTILEYSEFLCPYCQRQHNQGTVDAVMEEFDGEVNTAYRHFIVHPAAKKFAEASECVADIEGVDAHIEFIDELFGLTAAVSDESMATILDDMGRDSKKINACIDEGKFSSEIDAQTQEGRSLFAVKGTPGNVIIDHETGRFILIPGAYPPEKFIEEINNLLK